MAGVRRRAPEQDAGVLRERCDAMGSGGRGGSHGSAATAVRRVGDGVNTVTGSSRLRRAWQILREREGGSTVTTSTTAAVGRRERDGSGYGGAEGSGGGSEDGEGGRSGFGGREDGDSDDDERRR